MAVLRWLLALISVTVFMVVVPQAAYQYLTTPGLSIRQSDFIQRQFPERPVHIPDTPYNDLTDGGIQAKVSLSTNLFQIALLMTAALAGLLIAKDREARFILAKPLEFIMFSCAGLLLLLSFVSHFLYLNEIAYLYQLAGRLYDPARPSMPDISGDIVNFLLAYQFKYLMFGLLLAGFTFLSAHVLKRR